MRLRARLSGVLLLAVAAAGACSRKNTAAPADPLSRAYDVEPDWNDPQHVIPLDFQQAQGKRIFYEKCVWCHADSTPAGPSNRSNLSPTPALINDGARLNAMSDEDLRNIIAFGGSALGKSAMMPPWNGSLTPSEIQAVIAYTRAIAQPPYQPPPRAASPTR